MFVKNYKKLYMAYPKKKWFKSWLFFVIVGVVGSSAILTIVKKVSPQISEKIEDLQQKTNDVIPQS